MYPSFISSHLFICSIKGGITVPTAMVPDMTWYKTEMMWPIHRLVHPSIFNCSGWLWMEMYQQACWLFWAAHSVLCYRICVACWPRASLLSSVLGSS
jgi:hypothetical protein